MPYEQYTNQSDEIFSQQMDSMKLSSTTIDPNFSSLGASVAGANLGLDRELGLDMESKMRMHGASMRTREAISVDNVKGELASAYKDAMDVWKNEAIPGDLEGNARLAQRLSIQHAGNKEVQDALNGFSASDNRIAEARNKSFINKKNEDVERLYDLTRDQEEETYLNQKNAALLESIEKSAAARLGQGATEAQVGAHRATTAGNVGAIDQELGDRFSVMYGMAEELDLDPSVLSIMDGLSASIIESDGLDRAAGLDMGKHMKGIQELQSKGVDLGKMSDEEAVNTYMDKIKANRQVPMTAQEEAEIRKSLNKSVGVYREKEAIAAMKDQILESIKGIMPEDPSTMTEDDKKKVKAELLKLNSRMQVQVNGKIRKMTKDYTTSLELAKASRAAQKEAVDILNTESLYKSRDAKLRIAQSLMKMKQNDANRTQFLDVWGKMSTDQKDVLFKEYLQSKGIKSKESIDEYLEENNISIQDFLLDFAAGYSEGDGGSNRFPESE